MSYRHYSQIIIILSARPLSRSIPLGFCDIFNNHILYQISYLGPPPIMKFLVGAVREPPLRVDFYGNAFWDANTNHDDIFLLLP